MSGFRVRIRVLAKRKKGVFWAPLKSRGVSVKANPATIQIN